MDVFRHFCTVPDRAKGCVVAIGNFDGVHLGHQKLLNDAKAAGLALHTPAAVLTFDPHPRLFMQPDRPPFGLAGLPAKVNRLRHQRMSYCFIAKFDRYLSETSPLDFVSEWLVHRLAVRHVFVGEDYRFGHKRMGDTDLLRSMGRRLGFGVTAVAPLRDEGGVVVSSSRIRSALASGMPRTAAGLLGRPWEVFASVRGRAGNAIVASLSGYQPPGAGLYAMNALVDGDDLPIETPVTTGRIVRCDDGCELRIPCDTLPTPVSTFRIRLLDRVERHDE